MDILLLPMDSCYAQHDSFANQSLNLLSSLNSFPLCSILSEGFSHVSFWKRFIWICRENLQQGVGNVCYLNSMVYSFIYDSNIFMSIVYIYQLMFITLCLPWKVVVFDFIENIELQLSQIMLFYMVLITSDACHSLTCGYV